MNSAQAMTWIRFAAFCLDLVLKYGPRLLKLLRREYWVVEKKALEETVVSGVLPASEMKSVWFRRGVARIWTAKKGAMPDEKRMAQVERDIWRIENGRLAVPRPRTEGRRLARDEVIACRREMVHVHDMLAKFGNGKGAA